MKRMLMTAVLLAGTAAVALPGPAQAQAPTEPGRNVPVVTGTVWTQSTERERHAFLIGVATLAVAEMHGQAGQPSAIVTTLARNMKGETIADVSKKIDAYYAEHPNDIHETVARVIWDTWGGGKTAPLKMPPASATANGGMSEAFAKSIFNPGSGGANG
jgi:hypothetical protein